MGFIEKEPDEWEIDLGVFAFVLVDFFPAAVEAPFVVHLFDQDAGEHGADVPGEGTGTAEIEYNEFTALNDFVDFGAGGTEDTPAFGFVQAAAECIFDVS